MKQEKLTWLSFSLFCNSKYWHQLLSDGILLFMSIGSNERLIKSYCIEINYEIADNIRLLLLTSKKDADELAFNTRNFFKLFFLNSDFIPNFFEKLTYKHLFMPFPENTIQCGIYFTPISIKSELSSKFYFEKEFSNLILNVLGKKPFSEDEVFSFALYLHFLWIKTLLYSEIENEIKRNCLNYYKNIDLALYGIDPKTLSSIRESIKDIYKEVMSCEEIIYDGDKHWFEEWIVLCKKRIRQDILFEDKQDNKHVFNINVSSIIVKQLGYANGSAKALMLYLVNTMLPI